MSTEQRFQAALRTSVGSPNWDFGTRMGVAKLFSLFFKSLRERQQTSPSVHISFTVPTREELRSPHEPALVWRDKRPLPAVGDRV